MLALRVIQAGALASVLLVVPYVPFELDRFFIPKELALHLTACFAGLLLLPSARRLQPTRVDGFLLAFLAAGLLSALLASNGWNAARALALSTSGVTLFWCGRLLREKGLATPVLHALAVAVVVAAATALLQAYGLQTVFFTESRSPGGLLGNRNAIGHFAALGLPVVILTVLTASRSRTRLLGLIGIALVVAALVLTRSRAAWLGIGVVLVVVVASLVVLAVQHRAWKMLARFTLLVMVMGAGTAAALLLPNTLRWNSDAPYLETARGVTNYREGSGRGRLVQYQTSLQMALAHPLLGVGPGNWPVAYPGFARRNDPSMSTRDAGRTANPWPSSDVVALVSERGLASALLVLLAGIGLALGTGRALWQAVSLEASLQALTLLAVVAGTLTVGLFDAVLLLAWPTLFLSLAAGTLWDPGMAKPLAWPAWVQPLVLALLVAASGAATARSAGQIGAMYLYVGNGSSASLEQASRLDPGNYRLRLRLAQHRGDTGSRCTHARAARDLYPHAVAARRQAQRCR